MGSGFAFPTPAPRRYLLVGDAASVPAINSLIAQIDAATPVMVWLEYAREADRLVPVAGGDNVSVTYIPRVPGGAGILSAVEAAAATFSERGDAIFGWVACDVFTTRKVAGVFRSTYGMAKHNHKAQGYWMEPLRRARAQAA